MKTCNKKSNKKYNKKAICQVRGSSDEKVKGYVIFEEFEEKMKISLDLKDLPAGKRGFHIHEKGNLLEGCASLCSHFNPTKKTHGKLNDANSHAGDLGNITINSDGTLKKNMYSKILRLSGKFNIIGRSVVIHAGVDDLGKGGNDESLKTGNAGKRIACGIIGHY